jgi:sialic acid synthase
LKPRDEIWIQNDGEKNSKMLYEPAISIAEIGCNHKGDFQTAKELIELAKSCNASYAKFQKRNPKELLSEEVYNNPHPNEMHSYGDTYGQHRENLEFTIDQHRLLRDFCNQIGIKYATSVWDVTSAKEIITLRPDFIKVPSACNNHFELLEELRDNYKGHVHVSLGMTTKQEEKEIVALFEETGDAKERLVLYACTSGYPVAFEDVCLLEINRLNQTYGKRIHKFGFSGHHLGIAVDIAAYTLGATFIERHFTKDRTWKGTDHAASLEPTGFSKLARDLDAASKALSLKNQELLEVELQQRLKLKYIK